ncbi:MAG: hypothetical protein HY094_04630 [Candidatus Melainabacteria bacterium]|nr:hypothetical protein [Candidatus Melainabacteria bacterium]
MPLYVNHVGILLLGKPHRSHHKISIDKAIKEHTLDSFLSHIKPAGKEYLINAINTSKTVMWAGNLIPLGTIIRENIIKEIVPIIEAGKIPDNLDYSKLVDELGTLNKEELEEALFYLIQDITSQELD